MFTVDELRTIERLASRASDDRRKRFERLTGKGRTYRPAPGHRDANLEAVAHLDRIAASCRKEIGLMTEGAA